MRRTSIATIGLLGIVFALSAEPAVIHAQQAAQGSAAKAPPYATVALRKFVFTLVLGDMLTTPGSTFTPAASKALADLKDFLPYKRYTLLDTIYQIGPNGQGAQMKGIDDAQKYDLITQGNAHAVPSRTSLRVHLRTGPTQDRPPVFIIDTSFDLELGETVVVGTSRIDGNRALLLLVTSVP